VHRKDIITAYRMAFNACSIIIHKVTGKPGKVIKTIHFTRFKDNEPSLVRPTNQLRAVHCSRGTPTGG